MQERDLGKEPLSEAEIEALIGDCRRDGIPEYALGLLSTTGIQETTTDQDTSYRPHGPGSQSHQTPDCGQRAGEGHRV